MILSMSIQIKLVLGNWNLLKYLEIKNKTFCCFFVVVFLGGVVGGGVSGQFIRQYGKCPKISTPKLPTK